MCNNKGGIAVSSIDHNHNHNYNLNLNHDHVVLMDGHGSPPILEDSPRVKFLCSFSGSILPRPQDGKLRYVGGETRIVSVSRDIGFDELMGKMRELYDGTAVIKYQQPDEDLDALVSVVNDEDVVNMMEEYDKLGSAGDGFTRLRIFLFSQPENNDVSSQHYDGDERETERRYVDALNNLNDGPATADFRRQLGLESSSPGISPVDDLHAAAEQYFRSLSLESGVHGGRSYEMALPMYNLRHLSIPHVGSGQHIPVETPWSPAYYSPRPVAEFPTSPSSARFHVPFGELPMPEDYSRVNQQQGVFDHQSHYSESSIAWQPSDKSAFPGNIFHGHGGVEGGGSSSICEHCRMAFHRNFEHPSMNNGQHQIPNPSVDSPPNRESFVVSGDAKTHSHHGFYPNNEQSSDHRSLYNEGALSHERGWVLQQQQLNPRADESRSSVCGSVRMNDHYPIDSAGVNLPLGHGNVVEGRHVLSNYLHHRPGHEIGNEVFHEQTVVGTPHIHVPSHEESGVRYGNLPYPYVGENLYPAHGHVVPGHPLWRNAQSQAHLGHSYEANSMTQVGGKVTPGLPRGQWEGAPRVCVGLDNPDPSVEASKIFPFDSKAVPEYACGHASRINSTTQVQDHHQLVFPDLIRVSPDSAKCDSVRESDKEAARSDEKSVIDDEQEVNQAEKGESSDAQDVLPSSELKTVGDNNGEVLSPGSLNSSCIKFADECADVVKPGVNEHSAPEDINSGGKQSVLPNIAVANKASSDEADDREVKLEEDIDVLKNGSRAQEVSPTELESVSARADTELDSDSDNINTSRIEPTKAEAEAIDKGLQTIKNDDLEEIRELGSGTYGAVYHGKWRGSDVAIKRIKASCFAGRPSERERLIADFWKEALILGSLHHPNVVSFYGIVRDGPDGSLATVTEFMVNGSLKQFLQKKDRTIDRRKRLIIAMDAAFGMEYLHGKNIVHFDLKCENLLVNMRDPQRPVCKIGDLGLSKVKQHTLVSGGVRGTLPWMAPELLSGKSNMVTEKIDVYSFGIVMWELLTGEEPYADMHCASIIGGIVNNTLRPQIPTWCDPEWKSLMESCWASDPSQRPSFSEISQKLRNMAAAMNLK